MPSLVLYLDRVRPSRSFDEVELARLDAVYGRACAQLKVIEGDPSRETVAALVFQVADLSRDPDDLLGRVVALYRRPT
jgi:hypothetical protein